MFVVVKKNVIIAVLAGIVFFCMGVIAVRKNDMPVSLEENKTVVIDAGHGGIDGGCVGTDGEKEKDINLQIALKLEDKFKNNGYNVIMTRRTDTDLSEERHKTVRAKKTADLKKRAEIANEADCGLFISVHMNLYEDSSIRGAQVFFKKGDSIGEVYAKRVTDELFKISNTKKRNALPLPNKNLLFSKLVPPGILIECGFLSNEEESKLLKSEEYQKKIVEAVYNGVK